MHRAEGFPTPNGPVTVGGPGLSLIAEGMPLLVPGWIPQSLSESAAPDFEIFETGEILENGSEVPIEWDGPSDDPLVVAYRLATALFGALVHRRKSALILDAGVLIGKAQAIAFVGDSGAGKSSIALHLTADGHRILGDDRVIAFEADGADGDDQSNGPGWHAMALGLAQKLRLPLPVDFSPAARDHCEARIAQHIADSAFLAWDPKTQARFGEAAPLTGIVLLSRQPKSALALEAVGQSEAIRSLIGLTGDPGPATGHLSTLTRLVAAVPIQRLRYTASADAADALSRLV